MIMSLGILSVNPIQLGMQFLEKEPNKFECLVNSQWTACDKTTICSNYKDEHREGVSYRAIRSDPEYLDNWVDKLALLC